MESKSQKLFYPVYVLFFLLQKSRFQIKRLFNGNLTVQPLPAPALPGLRCAHPAHELLNLLTSRLGSPV